MGITMTSNYYHECQFQYNIDGWAEKGWLEKQKFGNPRAYKVCKKRTISAFNGSESAKDIKVRFMQQNYQNKYSSNN